ncbi:carbamoyltransferase [Pedobacter lusitanus]|uniref:Carbamoyltransferase n=1 Tax=Pedobacter lusitanus TaxID=1503925 RepID=A0A0D0FY49_9SPHI|nr:carbamoyltransferase C-terminal domain-containing protein [Pedobacter lusitanus]KIO77469.1 carbamoyltransferase [Pedobacter lusitanus]
MYTLGLNAVFHDSSACIFKDGILLAAAEDERFTEIKHGKRPVPFSTYELPFHAIFYCLEVAGIHLREVDHIAYSFNPYLLIPESQLSSAQAEIPFNPECYTYGENKNPWHNLFLSYLLNAPLQLIDGYPNHLQKRFAGSKETDWTWHYVDHHLAHAASAYLPSPYQEAAVLTIDGRGEIATTTYNTAKDNEIKRINAVNMPNSLGLLYEKITSHLGFLHSSDEYRIMALAAYGKPEFEKDFQQMIEMENNGLYTIKEKNFTELFGIPRMKDEPLTKRHLNIACSLQKVLEEQVLKMTAWLYESAKQENLCLAGGVALNCVLNSRICQSGPFKRVWVQPASGDSGTALGAAMHIDNQVRKNKTKTFIMDHTYWGPEYSDAEIEKFLNHAKIPYYKMNDIADETAILLAENKIIGWFQGKMEFGPRSLGSRSILASPINPEMQQRLNELKDREDFRPVAPVVLEEEAPEWFKEITASPFMLFVYKIAANKEDLIPAVKHVDGTARVQTINERQHPLYYQLLKSFKEKTGIPVLINTSFNTLGKPIVCSPRDAIACFWTSAFDALVIGSFLIRKEHGNKSISSYTYLQAAEALD